MIELDLRRATLAAALLTLPLAALAQQQDDEPLRPEDVLGGGADPRERIVELFHEIEGTLFEISDDLAEAGSGGALDDVGDGGIQKLLDEVTGKGRSVTAGIDELLEIAQQMGGPSMQGSMNQEGQQQQSQGQQGQQQQQGQPGESPLDQQRSGSSGQREETPEGPRPEDGQGGEQPQGQQPQGQQQPQPGAEGEQPDDGGENPLGGENQAGPDDGRRRGEGSGGERDADAWGHLPPRTQQVFRNQGGEDLPLQYREWIDSYYRRLNQGD